MILAVESFPRSGNSLFQTLAFELGPIWVLNGRELELITERVEAPDYGIKYDPYNKDDPYHERINRDGVLILQKVHGIPPGLKCDLAIHIHRNPVDAFHSYCEMHEYLKGSYELLMHQLLKSTRSDCWGAYIRERISDPNVKLHLGFEEILNCGSEFLKTNLESIGFSFPKFRYCVVKFGELHEKTPWFFRSGTVGQQPRKAEYADIIRATYKHEMRLLGYE